MLPSFSDQFCSLTFTLSHLYFVGCIYANGFVHGFDPDWQKCSIPTSRWPVGFVFAALPLFVRLVQCVRRFVDSKLDMHLINVSFLRIYSS